MRIIFKQGSIEKPLIFKIILYSFLYSHQNGKEF